MLGCVEWPYLAHNLLLFVGLAEYLFHFDNHGGGEMSEVKSDLKIDEEGKTAFPASKFIWLRLVGLLCFLSIATLITYSAICYIYYLFSR
jgi:hypothetical protein